MQYTKKQVVEELVKRGILPKVYQNFVLRVLELVGNEDIVFVLLKFADGFKLARFIAEFFGVEYVERVPLKRYRVERDFYLIDHQERKLYTYLFDIGYVKRVMSIYGKDLRVVVVPFPVFQEVVFQLRRDEAPEEKIKHIKETGGDRKGELLFYYVLEQAYFRRASDVHLECIGSGGIVKFRVGGSLQVFCSLSNELYLLLINYIKSRIGKGGVAKDLRKDGSINVKIAGHEVDLRVNIMPASPYVEEENFTYERCVIRILRKSATLMYTLEQLGLEEKEVDIIRTASNSAYGMIITSGPTSSGKTTTLYAILNTLNALEKKIVTVEDPIEYQNFYLWQQHQVSVNMSFAEILKGVLREDPDVCLVGEVRDEESARALVHLASTGHLTFSTVHANNAFEVIRRLKDFNVAEKDIIEYGVLFMAQRLLRASCPYCQYERRLSEGERVLLGRVLEEFDLVKVMDNKGCERCKFLGSTDQRILVMEILPLFDEELKEKIRGGEISSYKKAFEYVERRFGLLPLLKKALVLNKERKVAFSEVLAKVK